MRNLRATNFLACGVLACGLLGCSEKSGVEEKTKITGPEGTTTITKDMKVESSGKNPPITAEPGATGSTTTTTVTPAK